MHRKKNRKINPAAKRQIIQVDRCPGCGVGIKSFDGEHGQVCHDGKKARIEGGTEFRRERRGRA